MSIPEDYIPDIPGQFQARANTTPWSKNLATPRVALAIGAHPDDIEFGCGGTLAKWAAAGCLVHHLILTDGSKGSWDPTEDRATLVAARQIEQRNAAAALGATGRVEFLGWPDGELQSGIQQQWQVAFWIRKLVPNVVLGHDPWCRYRLHPDHRHAGFLTTDGIVAARDPHFFAEQNMPHHRPDALLLWEADEPDHGEDVTGFVAAKLAGIQAHHSQFRSTMGVDRTSPDANAQLDAFRERISVRLSEHGATIGAPHAEAFKVITAL